jgi:integrase
MSGRQAKVLSDKLIEDLLVYTCTTRHPERNRVIVLPSIKAGLRAGEIANLTWDMVVGPAGDVESVFSLRVDAAKNNTGRRIPLHPDLRAALIVWHSKAAATAGPVIASERGPRMTAVSIVNWFAKAFGATGLAGCSSHLGRRTFITRRAGSCIKPGHRCAMFSYWLGIDRSKRPNDTSTAIQTPSASSSR